jgi:uncharacterized damage-inducible protein DinB
MDARDIQLLFAYDRWANARVLAAAEKLTREQFVRDLGGSFKSVRDTLVHIVGGQAIWLAFWQATDRSEAAVTELKQRQAEDFDPAHYPDLASVRSKAASVEKELAAFVSTLSDDDLQTEITNRGVQVKLAGTLQHLANHGTYHRGQIALMMRQLGAEPSATDLSLFLVERAAKGATGS